MSNNNPVKVPETVGRMLERLGGTMDALMDGKMTPEVANALANVAEKAQLFAKIELAAIDLALSNDREIASSGFLPDIEEASDQRRIPSKVKLVGR